MIPCSSLLASPIGKSQSFHPLTVYLITRITVQDFPSRKETSCAQIICVFLRWYRLAKYRPDEKVKDHVGRPAPPNALEGKKRGNCWAISQSQAAFICE